MSRGGWSTQLSHLSVRWTIDLLLGEGAHTYAACAASVVSTSFAARCIAIAISNGESRGVIFYDTRAIPVISRKVIIRLGAWHFYWRYRATGNDLITESRELKVAAVKRNAYVAAARAELTCSYSLKTIHIIYVCIWHNSSSTLHLPNRHNVVLEMHIRGSSSQIHSNRFVKTDNERRIMRFNRPTELVANCLSFHCNESETRIQ